MGGRGSSSGRGAKGGGSSKIQVQYTTSDKTVQVIAPRTIMTGWDSGNEDIDSVLEVKAKGNGEISLSKNWGDVVGGSRKHPTREHNISGASILTKKDYGSMPQDNGINWDNVKIITGKTYGIGTLVKTKGFVWDREKNAWVKESK